MIALIDSDILLFRSCCSVEYTTYLHPEEGTFRRKKELTDFLKFQYDPDGPEQNLEHIKPIVVTEPVKRAFQAFDASIASIMRETDADSYTLVVKGEKENFRKSIPYPVEYKGGRAEKPSNYKQVQEYMLSLPNLYFAEGMEVDDALGILQDKETDTTVICTVDKDLKMIPGLYFHLDKKKMVKITEDVGNRYFWMQMLTGDSTDNILGIRGIGEKIAEKLLPPDMSWEHMEYKVREEYDKFFGPEKGDMMYKANQRLLWILREPLNEIS